MPFLTQVGHALLMTVGMMWQTGWTLVLGFTISSLLQTVVPAEKMRAALSGGGPTDIAAATALGAASSSCSYASAAIMRTLFKKGAALSTSLAFMFSSTNLVLELGIILYVLMGWQFMAGEWIGGIVLVTVMSLLLRLVYPKALIEEARRHEEAGSGHHHMSMTVEGDTWWERLRNPKTRVRVAQNFAMEWSMLYKDLLIGFVVGGFLAAFVPDAWWKAMFLQDASPWIKVPFDALIGPVVACLTFVCSIGNVPLAAVLWAGGASFGGVLAFLYADLLVLPLLDVYRRYFGWRMAAFMAGLFFVTMAVSALVMDLAFSALGLVPSHDTDVRAQLTDFSLNYTFWLDLAFGALALYLFWLNGRHPMIHGHHADGDHASIDGHGGEPAHGQA